MRRIGVISDIHGNLEALEAVLKSLGQDGVDHLVHLGDLVGYNANPRECLELAREHGITGVMGNHDLAILDPRVAEDFNVLAHQALHYSAGQLTEEDRRYLETLPGSVTLLDQYLFCHGTPESIGSYILHVFQAKRVFNLLQKRHAAVHACFFGHTHLQRVWIRDERGKVTSPNATPGVLRLEEEKLYLVNPGSVGQPRQGNSRAHYLIFDVASGVVHFRSVAYDIRRAQKKILEAGLPQYLALRLQEGV